MKKALDHLKKSDPVLRGIIETVGPYRPQFADPDFRSLARSIVFQQLNGKAASTIFGRLEEGCGGAAKFTTAVLARMRMARLRSFGLSMQKASYVKDLATRTARGEIDFASLPAMADADVIAALTQVKGIGVWTVHMFLIFALRRPDVLPVGDYGIRAAMKKAYSLDDMPKPAEMERIAAPWRPWASVASRYLWRSLDGPGAP